MRNERRLFQAGGMSRAKVTKSERIEVKFLEHDKPVCLAEGQIRNEKYGNLLCKTWETEGDSSQESGFL